MERIQTVIVGAGVVGLAVGRALAQMGREVVIIEANNQMGQGVTARNSEVIHAGLYYQPKSLKARLCVAGNTSLRQLCQSHGIPHRMIGKIIVATNDAEITKLNALYLRGLENGVELTPLSQSDVAALEPELLCRQALFSPNTGIIDVSQLMLALRHDFGQSGGMMVFGAPVLGGHGTDEGVVLDVGGQQSCQILAPKVIVAAGLGTCALMRKLGAQNVPQEYLCKGNYFRLNGPAPFRHLVYPMPVAAGLGIHYTLDMNGSGRFGPDVEWIEHEDYTVDSQRAAAFAGAISSYWPHIRAVDLVPDYAGIRPKIHGPHQEQPDFLIHSARETGVSGLMALYGIESPGLTSALGLGEFLKDF